MAASPLAWNQEYEQVGRGRFEGRLDQLVLGGVQVGRIRWSPGVIQRGGAPNGTWVFGFPLMMQGTLHLRRRPARPDQLLVATEPDDIGFAANGSTDMMVVVLPVERMRAWMRSRRGEDVDEVGRASARWRISPVELVRRAQSLASCVESMVDSDAARVAPGDFSRIEAWLLDAVLDLVPSEEAVLPVHRRARIARSVIEALRDRVEEPPTIAELCGMVGARERTLQLSCVEAFGRSPGALLLELRLNAVQRVLKAPGPETTVTGTAVRFGFVHLSRFAAMYARKFQELPSITLSRSRAWLGYCDRRAEQVRRAEHVRHR